MDTEESAAIPISPDKAERRARRWQSRCFLAGLGCLPVLLVGIVLCLLVLGWMVERDIRALEAEIRAKGEPATMAELDAYYPQVPEEENGALVYMEAFKLLSENEDAGACDLEDMTLETHLQGNDFTLETLGKAHVYIAEREAVFSAAARAMDYTEFRYPVDLSPTEGTGWREFPQSGLLSFERLLWLQSVVAIHERDWEVFSRSQSHLLHMADSLAEMPGLGQMLRLRMVRRAREVMERAIASGEAPPPLLRELAGEYGAVDVAHSFRSYIIGSRISEPDVLDRYYRGEIELESYMEPVVPMYAWCYRTFRFFPGVSGLARRHVLQRMRYYTDILNGHGAPWWEHYAGAARRQPYVERGGHAIDAPWHRDKPWREIAVNRIASVITRLDSDYWWERRTYLPDRTFAYAPLQLRDLVTLVAYPDSHPPPHWVGFPPFDMHDSTGLVVRLETMLRCVRLAMLVELYRQEHGVLPETLDALDGDAVAAIGGDPFKGTPLGYRVVEGGFTLYSVGEDLVDDGGNGRGAETRDLVMLFVEDTRVIPEKHPPREERRNRGGLLGLGRGA